MLELIARANQAILEAQRLQREGHSLRVKAATLATQLGESVLQSRGVKKELSPPQTSVDQSVSIGA